MYCFPSVAAHEEPRRQGNQCTLFPKCRGSRRTSSPRESVSVLFPKCRGSRRTSLPRESVSVISECIVSQVLRLTKNLVAKGTSECIVSQVSRLTKNLVAKGTSECIVSQVLRLTKKVSFGIFKLEKLMLCELVLLRSLVIVSIISIAFFFCLEVYRLTLH